MSEEISKEMSEQEKEEIAVTKKLIKWVNVGQLEQHCEIEVQEMDISIACQYSGNQVVKPARSESCDIACLVEKDVLAETMVCSCGKEIDEENYYVEDWDLQEIVAFIKRKYSGKVKMVRLDLVNHRFWPV